MSIWVLRGLRDGVVTSRWPAKPDPYADAWRGPARPHGAPDPGSPADPTDLCPTGAITMERLCGFEPWAPLPGPGEEAA